MKNIRNLIILAGVSFLSAGCIIQQPQVAHHPPPPAPTPPPSNTASIVVPRPAPGRPAQPPPTASAPTKEPWVNVSITTGERQTIREYVTSCEDEPVHKHQGKGHKAKSLPPGLAKKAARGESLPPGWQNKVVKGEIMPVEVYRECQPLPQEVTVKLPPPPAGTILVTIEGKIVRLLQATREILDVFDIHA